MGTEHFNEAQKKASQRNHDPDDEDSNLLGFPKKPANDAVEIAKPSSTMHSHRVTKPYGGGTRPMNTLSGSNQRDRIQSTRRADTLQKQHMLMVDVSRGYNVQSSQEVEVFDSFEAPRSAKRQKLIHVNSASSTSSVESVDELPAADVSYKVQPHKDPITYPRSPGLGSGNGRQARIATARDFGGIERMMDSSPKNAKSKRSGRHRKAASRLAQRLSGTMSFEAMGGAKQMTTADVATDSPPNEAVTSKRSELSHGDGNKKDDRKTSGVQIESPYFQERTNLPRLPVRENQTLRSQFVDSEGAQRGIGDHLSSDELDGPATIGEYADVVPLSPNKGRQPASSKNSTSMVKSSDSLAEAQQLERSNIKPTVFASQTSSKRKGARQSDFDKDYFDGDNSPWAVPLRAVNLPGQDLPIHSSLKFVYDEANQVYFVEEGGKALKVSGSSLQVYPRSLQRGWWEDSGRRVRFESSKRGIVDNVLDLELESEKDLIELTKKMQNESTNVKFNIEDSEKMLKRFENRRKQPKQSSPVRGFEDMDEGAQLAAANQRRRESRNLAGREMSNIGRRQSTLRGSLINSSKNDESASVPPSNGEARARQGNLHARYMNGSSNKVGDRSSIFGKLLPTHNDHLRRSTRTSGLPTRYLEGSEESREPAVEKYSVKFGLGKKWSKPLSYPKTGKKKATVEWEDLERLDEGEFLNDNLVSFYMRYLEQEFTDKNPELAKTVYFFNSFFYDRLTTTQKGQKGINYEGVQRWTRGVDLFAYDYIIVPINELAHWYVAIICNLPALVRCEDGSDEILSPASVKNEDGDTALPSTAIEDDLPEPQEKQARQSFAELSLDGKPNKRQLSEDSLVGLLDPASVKEAVAVVDEDQEMLDVPNVAENGIAVVESVNAEKEVNAAKEVGEEPRGSAPVKKQKRKSWLPSITKRDPASPAIITFDSFGHSHSLVIRVLKQYLFEEGIAKRNTQFNIGEIKGITAKNIPQQNNFSDCGLYMLGYVEKFLEDHPKDFIVKIIKREYDDRKDWPKMVPSNMRNDLRKQLQKLHDEDQAERDAIKVAKRASMPRNAKAGSPALKGGLEDTEKADLPNENGEYGSPSLEPEKGEIEDVAPSEGVQIHNDESNSPSTVKNDHVEAGKPTKSPEPINGTTLNRSLVIIDSQSRVKVTNKESGLEVPSSQPSRHSTPVDEVKRASPVLPNEIEDSQPLRPPTSGPDRLPDIQQAVESNSPKDNASGDLPTSPHLSNQGLTGNDHPSDAGAEKKKSQTQSMVYSNWKPPGERKLVRPGAPVSPPRPRRKGTPQRMQQPCSQQQQQRRKKMTKEEAIVLDD